MAKGNLEKVIEVNDTGEIGNLTTNIDEIEVLKSKRVTS